MGQRKIKFKEAEAYFSCPSCHKSMYVKNGSLLCRNNHCFDIAAKGYVNFLTGRMVHKTKYEKELFISRRNIFQAGFYNTVLKEIERTAEEQIQCGGSVLDAGCGEGFYANRLSQRHNVFALDNVKEAIQIAAGEKTDVKWMVSDLTNIPLMDNSMDMVLNILSPANYAEFNRVLKPDGILVKVLPGNDYLCEIRKRIFGQLQHKEYSNEEKISLFCENMELLRQSRLRYTLPVRSEEGNDFIRMTPMTFHVDTAGIGKLDRITIDLLCLVGAKKRQ